MQLIRIGCKITIVPVLKQFILMTSTNFFLKQIEQRG